MKKRLNQFKNELRKIRRLRLKQEQRTSLFKTKKMRKTLRDIFNTVIKNIKKKNELLNNALVNAQKNKSLF